MTAAQAGLGTPLLISVAPNGARRGKTDHTALPVSPAELAADARACAEAGAALYHLHVRDAHSRHSLDADAYRAAIAAIRAAVGERLLIQATTEACGVYSRDAQMAAVLALRPQAASFALNEFLPEGADPIPAHNFFRQVAAEGTAMQFILYTPQDARRLRALAADGTVPSLEPAVLFVFGRHADGPPSHPGALLPFLDAWEGVGPWSVCAFGLGETAIAAAAVALGGHVRVGFENNLQRPDGSLLACNAEQVARIADIARLVGRPLANAAVACALAGAGPSFELAGVPCD